MVLAVLAALLLVGASGMTAKLVGDTAASSAARVARVAEKAAAHAQAALAQAVQSRQLAHAIQRERHSAILQNCEEQNQRHSATVRTLDRVLAQAEHRARTAHRRARIKASRSSTVLLITALAPKRDCVKLARRQAPGG